jgi:RHS repeat-associated protein
MVLQSTFFDPVVGADVHIVGVPAPPAPLPVPTPVPMAFVGIVFDPAGLLLGAAIGMALGGGPGLVFVNGLPVTNCGTSVTNGLTMPHVSAPGIMFMDSGLPGKVGDAELYFGSSDVSLAGSYGVRLGDIALSCSNPIRLPTSVVMAAPKGAPVLNMPRMVPDLKAIAMAMAMRVAMRVLKAAVRAGARVFRALRRGSSFMGRVSDALGGCHAPANASRWRQMWHRAVRFATGHPVDVVTGNVFTEVVDVQLPGPLPLTIERVYESAGSGKPSALGYGWNHSLDESLWMEPGRAVVRLGDGREIEFGLWDLPGRTMRPGDVLERAIHKLKLRCVAQGRYEVHHPDGRIHELAHVAGGAMGVARLVRIRSLDGHHAIDLLYDSHAQLEWVRDACGRMLHFQHDDGGRLVALGLPRPDGDGFYVHRRYRYDGHGDLIEVEDALGHTWRYDYRGHLLVQETDRAGLSFYFQYDGVGSSAKCVRTWGDGGIYDHTIAYDPANRKTVVENSCGEMTIYELNVRNQVVAVTNALGETTRYDYDPMTGGQTLIVDSLGARTEQRYDDRGNLVEIVEPDGARTQIEYDEYLPTRALDPQGGEWRWRYDRGRLVERSFPSGERTVYGWIGGLLAWSQDVTGCRLTVQYDAQKNIAAMLLPNGTIQQYQSDLQGRPVLIRNFRGGETRIRYDAEGRIVWSQSPIMVQQTVAYDPEGNVLEIVDATRRVRLGYGHFHRVIWRGEAGTWLQFEYDTEDRLVGVVNEAGERHCFGLDGVGRVREEIGFDGRARTCSRDEAGRVIETLLPNGRHSKNVYDVVGRLLEVRHSDGTFARFGYGPGGFLRSAENESGVVELDRDLAGRVSAERFGEFAVHSRYGPSGHRTEMATSLGGRVAIGRDALGEVQALFLGGGVGGERQDAGVVFERDGLGLERARRFANGIDVQWERDKAGRPTVRSTIQRLGLAAGLALGAGGQPAMAFADTHVIEHRTYEWRGDDQIAAVADGLGETRRYEHDARGRLIRERKGEVEVIDRAMDAVGNVHRISEGQDRHYGRGGLLEVAEGLSYEYDCDGNLISKTGPDGDWHYKWNGHGMLVEVTRPDGVRVQFEYDAFARRTARRVMSADGGVRRTTKFVWDGHVVVHEIDSESGPTTWYWEPESFTPVVKERDGKRWTIASDQLGTPTEMYDEEGQLEWKMQIDVFGTAKFALGEADDCRWRWPGQYEDLDIGLYYNRFRYYDPRQGRYISPDPMGLVGGSAVYAYVPDPFVQSDPLGLHTVIGAVDGVPVTTADGDPRFRNTGGRNAPMAPSGYGRAGHSENLLMEASPRTGGTLVIESIDSTSPRTGGLWSALDPCFRNGDGCFTGLQRYATDNGMIVRYRVTVGGQDLPPVVGLRSWAVEFVFHPDPSRSHPRYPEGGSCR